MSRTRLTRRERLSLIRAALTGAVSGAVRAIIAWFLEQLASY
ncbi:hypothetical protein ACFW9L_03315 [Streptomyces sp. NPDC059517]